MELLSLILIQIILWDYQNLFILVLRAWMILASFSYNYEKKLIIIHVVICANKESE